VQNSKVLKLFDFRVFLVAIFASLLLSHILWKDGWTTQEAAVGNTFQSVKERGEALNMLSSNPQQSQIAYAVFCDGEAELEGALSLFLSLRKVNSRGDFVALVMNVSGNTLLSMHSLGVRVLEVEPLQIKLSWPATNDELERDLRSLSQLRVWQLDSYSTILFFDQHTVVVDNLDELFRMPEFSGISKRQRKLPSKTEQQADDVRDSTEEDDIIEGWSGLDYGVSVLTPSTSTFSKLLNELSILPTRPQNPVKDFLFTFFNDRKRFYRIPRQFIADIDYAELESDIRTPSDMKILYFY
jgi:hypothetical protein